MIRCIAIDDEPLALEQLKSYIRKVPYLELVAACLTPFEAVRLVATEEVDALFVDISMPDLNGLEFVRSLPHPPMVVFTTAYPDYAVEGYKVNAVDYLLKPFGLEDFRRAAEKLRELHEITNLPPAPARPATEADDILFLKSDYKLVSVRISAIRYVESMSEYLRFYLDDEPKPVVALLSMKRLEDSLPADRFMRVHRSYIVNLTKIQEVTKMRIVMDNKTYIPIGDYYKDRFLEHVEKCSLCK